jgi:hypothetical protein
VEMTGIYHKPAQRAFRKALLRHTHRSSVRVELLPPTAASRCQDRRPRFGSHFPRGGQRLWLGDLAGR